MAKNCIVVRGHNLHLSLREMTSHVQTINTGSATFNRTAIVFDVYLASSLKAQTRTKRGQGVDKGRQRPVRFPETGIAFSETTRLNYLTFWPKKWMFYAIFNSTLNDSCLTVTKKCILKSFCISDMLWQGSQQVIIKASATYV